MATGATSDANILIFNLSTVRMSTFLLICFLLFLILIQITQRMKFVRGFKHIPGPTSIPIFGNALQLTGTQAEFFKLIQQYSTKYTTMFRLWVGQRPFIFLHKAEAIQPLLNSSVHIEKSLEYRLLYPFLGTGLVTSTGRKWHAQRKFLTPVFHYDMLEDYIQPVLKGSNVLVKQLEREVGNSSFNVVPYTKLAALDVICDLTMGYQLNSQAKSNMQYVHAIEELMAIQQRRFITPWLKPDVLFSCSSYANRQQKCLEIVNGFSTKIIREKREEYLNSTKISKDTASPEPNTNNSQKKRGKVFLDLLFELSQNDSTLERDIRDQVNTFIFAGHDTTSTSVSWCLYVLGLHPEVQEKILLELNTKLPDFGKSPLKTSDVSSLEYLECCLKEVLRLYPPVPLIGRHTTESLNIMGQVIPSGASVLVNVYSLHRDPNNFPNPDAFIPERFISETSSRNPFCYIPFSAGPRNCIGQKLAIQSIKVIVANIIKSYRIKAVEREDNLNLVAEIVLNNENGIKIAIERR